MPSLDNEARFIVIGIAKQTLSLVADALEEGARLTPDVVRFADVSIIRENGKDVLHVTFPSEVDIPGDYDEDAWLDCGPDDL